MTVALWLLLGLILGAAFVAVARSRGRDETRVVALGLVVAATVYVGFAVAGAGAGWTLHAGWDVGLHLVGGGAAFAPEGYVVLCLAFDLVVAGYVAFGRGRVAWEAGRT